VIGPVWMMRMGRKGRGRGSEKRSWWMGGLSIPSSCFFITTYYLLWICILTWIIIILDVSIEFITNSNLPANTH
jgi:hypothetical protein